MESWYDNLQSKDPNEYLEGFRAYVGYMRAQAEEAGDMTAGRAIFDWMWSVYEAKDMTFSAEQLTELKTLTKEALSYGNENLVEYLYDQSNYLTLDEWKEWIDVLKMHKGNLWFTWLALHDYMVTDPEKLQVVRDLIGHLLGKPVDMEATSQSETLHGLWSFFYRLDMDQTRADRAAISQNAPQPAADSQLLARCRELITTIKTLPFPDDPEDESFEGRRATEQRKHIQFWAESYLRRDERQREAMS